MLLVYHNVLFSRALLEHPVSPLDARGPTNAANGGATHKYPMLSVCHNVGFARSNSNKFAQLKKKRTTPKMRGHVREPSHHQHQTPLVQCAITYRA